METEHRQLQWWLDNVYSVSHNRKHTNELNLKRVSKVHGKTKNDNHTIPHTD